MSHHLSRPTPARRIFAQYSDTYIAEQDQRDEDRRNSYRERKACNCLGRGCPECWGAGELDGEYDDEQESDE